jgi:hypothetical protein
MDNYSIESMPEPNARERRITRILLLIWLGLALIVGAILCYIVSQAFRPIPMVPVLVGELDEYPPDSVNVEFVNARFFDETANKELETIPLQVVRDANGDLTVFLARSTRQSEAIQAPQSCLVEWDDSIQQFLELCAGSRWTREGTHTGGPAPRDLDRFPARLEGQQLFIDLKLEPGAARP